VEEEESGDLSRENEIFLITSVGKLESFERKKRLVLLLFFFKIASPLLILATLRCYTMYLLNKGRI